MNGNTNNPLGAIAEAASRIGKHMTDLKELSDAELCELADRAVEFSVNGKIRPTDKETRVLRHAINREISENGK
jgi:hypothetical protein